MSRLGIRPGTKKVKHLQKVWFDTETYAWVLQQADALNMAPNTFIVEVVRKAREFCERGEWSPIAVQAVVEKVKTVVCPACLKEFRDVSEVRRHLNNDRLHARRWVEEAIGGGEGGGREG
jgi:hypothetical protein